MVPGLPTQTVTVVRAGTAIERGDAILDWSNATEHDIPGCIVQPMAGDEIHGNRDAVVNRWKVFAPASADVTSLDRIRHQGVVYDVEGDIRDWPGPIPGLEHLEFQIQRAEG